ncbi:MAG: hypothetical protein ACP5RW_09045 [bacterium]
MKKTLSYILCYIFWIVTLASSFFLFLLGREFYLKIMALLNTNRWSAGAIDKFLFLGLAILWLAFAIFTEAYYRKGVENSTLLPRFFYVTGIELLVLFFIQNIPLALVGLRFSLLEIILALGELLIGILLIFIAFTRKMV